MEKPAPAGYLIGATYPAVQLPRVSQLPYFSETSRMDAQRCPIFGFDSRASGGWEEPIDTECATALIPTCPFAK